MSAKLERTEVASETNQKAAGALWEVQERLDRIMGNPLVLPGFRTGEGGQQLGGFPAQYQAMKDPPVTEKLRVMDAVAKHYGPLPNPQVVIPFSDADVEAWKSKEKMVQQIQFDGWITEHYKPFDDPAEAEWLQKMYPEYFEARVKENEALHDLQAQWAKIQIQGPKSKEDLYLIYRAETDSDLWNRLSQTAGAQIADAAPAYTRGLYNSHRSRRRGEMQAFAGGAAIYTPRYEPAGAAAGLKAYSVKPPTWRAQPRAAGAAAPQ
jgi:hypothetical protein